MNRQTFYGHKLSYYCEDNWMYWERGGCHIRYIFSEIFNVKHKTIPNFHTLIHKRTVTPRTSRYIHTHYWKISFMKLLLIYIETEQTDFCRYKCYKKWWPVFVCLYGLLSHKSFLRWHHCSWCDLEELTWNLQIHCNELNYWFFSEFTSTWITKPLVLLYQLLHLQRQRENLGLACVFGYSV